MSPALAVRKTPMDELADLKGQIIGLLSPAMTHLSGRPTRSLSADEIATVQELNKEVQRRERKLGLRRH